MKTPRFILPILCLLSLSAAASAKEEVLLDFRHVSRDPGPNGKVYRCYEYAWNDWNRKIIDLAGKGALIQAPSGKGNLGESKTMLKLHKTPDIEIHYLIGNANKAGGLNFKLIDKDGTEWTWPVPLSGLARGIEQRLRLDLTKPGNETKPGTKPGLDLARLSTWEFIGDWGAAGVEVLLIKVVGLK
ncbi:MAG: hypothetical protein ACOZE5_16540 [Verrucomicrobiota bacterium]